jgi:rfaE bifunctional protein nucleotidyltransferase chain/domain
MKSKKIIPINVLKKILSKKKYKTSLVHGVFDVLHIGHKRYFEEAKSFSDILIVSITTDKFVNKGPSRPIFNHNLRAEMLASLECIDYVVLSENETAVTIINHLKPNFYVKGNDYKDLKKDLSKNIYKEKSAVEQNNGQLVFTDDIQFSSSNIINNFYKPETILGELKKLKLNSRKLKEKCMTSLSKISSLKIAIIGEIIIDEYIFSREMDKPSKENIHAVSFLDKEKYLGGVMAIAKNLSEFSNKIDIFSSGCFNSSETNFIKSIEKECGNIKTYLDHSNFQTIKKSRILDDRKKKIFEIYNKRGDVKYKESKKFIKILKEKFQSYDLVILCDFGHGFFNKNIYDLIIKNSKLVSINAQTNSDNRGFNLITKYNNANLVCIDEPEIRLALSDRVSTFKILAEKLSKIIKFNILVITRGNLGISIFKKINKKKLREVSLSAFELNPVDTIGAGDAVLGIASLLACKKTDIEVIAFLGNIFGALATKYLGHSSSIKKKDVLRAVTYSLK